jgi:hypothetical protein
VTLLAQGFALTPQREILLIYSQTDAGLCALVFDGQTVTAQANAPARPSPT